MNESLRGHFLVAGCRLRQSAFFKTVVLIVEHNEEGAMGLVINRPSEMTVAYALTGHLELPCKKNHVYLGGPVETSALFVVHDCSGLDAEEDAVIPGVYMGSSVDVFQKIVTQDDNDPHVNFRVYRGYAGWGAGQLEGELERGDWLTLPAQSRYVFSDDPYGVWDELLAATFRRNRLLALHCEHPDWN